MPLLSYDFQAPLGEMGQPNLLAFHQTRLLHQFLAEWGGELAAMDVDTLSEHYARRGCFEFRNDYVRMQHEEGVSYVRPVDMPWHGHRLTAQAQPFCHIGDTLYLVTIPGVKPKVWVDGRPFTSPLIRILDAPLARKAYKIGGRMLYARHDGGILYTAGDTVREESWHTTADVTSRARFTSREGALRQVTIGLQKVAAMPVDADFEASRTYDLDLSGLTKGRGPLSDLFLGIHYAADCARVYADGRLVADNFWNGKPMLVRLSDLAGKKVQLRILPLSKQAPIYLQQQQKERLMKARGEALLELDSIVLLERRDEVRELPRCIRLDGMWRFGTESTVGDSILLPGSMPQRLKGNVPDAHTRWVGAIYDSSFFHNLDRKARRTLERGGKVLLLAAGKVSYGREVKQQFLPVFWNTSWFKMRPPHTTGLFIDTQHPILAQFPTDSHSDLQWWELVNKAQVMLFSDFPSDFQPIVQSIDTWFVSRKIGMLFEARVGKGRLVMTTMDLSSRLDTRHAARQMRHSILAYMRSDRFAPTLTLDLQRVSDLFTKVAGEVDMFTHDSPDELKPKLK